MPMLSREHKCCHVDSWNFLGNSREYQSINHSFYKYIRNANFK